VRTESGWSPYQPIPERDLSNFAEDFREDFTEISPQRISGLEIARQLLASWMELNQ
jgi:hypothetical protein